MTYPLPIAVPKPATDLVFTSRYQAGGLVRHAGDVQAAGVLCLVLAWAWYEVACSPNCTHMPVALISVFCTVWFIYIGATARGAFDRVRAYAGGATGLVCRPGSVSCQMFGIQCDLPMNRINDVLLRHARADTAPWAGERCLIDGPVLVLAMKPGFHPPVVEFPLYALCQQTNQILAAIAHYREDGALSSIAATVIT